MVFPYYGLGCRLIKRKKGGLGYKLDNWSKTTRLKVKKRKSHFRTQFSCLYFSPCTVKRMFLLSSPVS